MSAAQQTIHLEIYEPQLRVAFARAQTFADERKNPTVTWYHLVHIMLGLGWGKEPCARAGVDPDALAGRLKSTLDGLRADAPEPSFLDSAVLDLMKRAEAAAARLTRSAVDFQCIFIALGEKDYVPAAVGNGTWSDDERTGSATKLTPSFETALYTASKAFDGLADQIASALGKGRAPQEVLRTLQKIRAMFYAPNEVAELLVERHDDCTLIGREGKSEDIIVLQWGPPSAIELVSGFGEQRATQRFELVKETNTWRCGDRELFAAIREAILALYPETSRPPN